MTADIVVQALNMAIKRRKPTKGLIVHSDREVNTVATPIVT